jgi:drug/metabolite transporter (DMT)-like permease
MVAAAVLFAIMSAFVKLTRRLPSWEVTFFRALINTLILTPWALRNRAIVREWRKEPLPLFTRGVFGCASIALYFYAISHMKLADAAMLNYSSPIVTLALSALFLGERLNAATISCVLVAFGGIGLILKPGHGAAPPLLAACAGLASAFTSAVAYVSIKVATRSFRPRLIVFTFAAVSTLISVGPMLANYWQPTGMEWFFLLVTGVIATIAQEAMTRAYAGLPASVASPMLMLAVVFSSTIAWIFWKEAPDSWSILGGLLVAGGVIGAYRLRAD